MSTPAHETYGIFNCPNCGAAAAPESVSCAYCGSSLATRVCASCFGAVSVRMHHCPWCGSGEGADQPVAGIDRNCPRCEAGLSRIDVGTHTVQECTRCGGLWVDKDTFQQICTREEEQEAVLGRVEGADAGITDAKPAAERAYVPCPECGKLMNRRQFAGCSRVILDWCREHGMWFDRHELHQIVKFIQGGGLKKSRDREKQKLEDEKARLRQQQISLSARSLPAGEGSLLSIGWKEDSDPLLRVLSSMWSGLNK